MSIAFNAAPFDANISKSTNERKRKNKTIKKDREKVNNMIDIIHNSQEDNNLSDFNPLPKPEINNKNNTIENFNNNQENFDIQDNPINNENTSSNDFNVSPGNYNEIENNYTKENSSSYIDQIIPYYNNMSEPNTSKDVLIKKLNYMIHLLEEQKSIKTEHVTEELILYSFLGVFIIFIIDSFVRAGKYIR